MNKDTHETNELIVDDTDELMDGWTCIGGEKAILVDNKGKDAEVQVHFMEEKHQNDKMGLFGALSNIILLQVLSLLDDYELTQLAITSSAMNTTASSEFLWERLYMREFVNNKSSNTSATTLNSNNNTNPNTNTNNNNNNNNNNKNYNNVRSSNNNIVNRKKAKLINAIFYNQQECGGFKALYGTEYCAQRLHTTLRALRDSATPNNNKLNWICKPLVSAHNFFVATEAKVLMLGLDGAGKTAMLYKFVREEVVPTTHTIGYNFEKVTHKDFVFEICDLEYKHDNPLTYWKKYLKDVRALIFVVDCSDVQNIPKATAGLQMLVKSKLLDELPLLVYANKRDVPGALSTLQVITHLGLHKLVNKKGWHVQASSIVDEEFGLYEGLDWLVSKLQSEEVEKLQDAMHGKRVTTK